MTELVILCDELLNCLQLLRLAWAVLNKDENEVIRSLQSTAFVPKNDDSGKFENGMCI